MPTAGEIVRGKAFKLLSCRQINCQGQVSILTNKQFVPMFNYTSPVIGHLLVVKSTEQRVL